MVYCIVYAALLHVPGKKSLQGHFDYSRTLSFDGHSHLARLFTAEEMDFLYS